MDISKYAVRSSRTNYNCLMVGIVCFGMENLNGRTSDFDDMVRSLGVPDMFCLRFQTIRHLVGPNLDGSGKKLCLHAECH